ncbi:hypothetical protein PM10SUCC1_29170 [Propionigenium maris DSM 9537]|uniref:OmpA-like domain-containing protein n=1 Tax=Propionigenium maris DSM 9537 TaxID=1123000 RepID=A0A9W6GMV1_9FUSO|nr:OmpA family protein [Propionigenium maris]GLI57403.1 hypothetical protein PM10SUCC1_29170 [Propionigenium maris DSM 9537]
MKYILLMAVVLIVTSCKPYQERLRVVSYDKVKLPEVEIKAEVESGLGKKLLVLDDILGTFDFDRGTLQYSTITSETVRESVVDKIFNKSGVLTIIGHTDSIGSKEYNVSLSYRRASSVADLIMSLLPLDSGVEVEIIGRGMEDPLVPNDSRSNRRKNRRVEIYFAEGEAE